MIRHISKKAAILIAALILFQAIPMASATDGGSIQPWYIGVSSMMPNVEISTSGRAKCSDTVRVKNGYTASVTWKFQILSGTQWVTKATWTASGGGTLYLDKGYNVTQGSQCRLYTSVVVYNSNGTVVETPTRTSNTASY